MPTPTFHQSQQLDAPFSLRTIETADRYDTAHHVSLPFGLMLTVMAVEPSVKYGTSRRQRHHPIAIGPRQTANSTYHIKAHHPELAMMHSHL